MLSFEYELIYDPHRIWKSIDRFKNLKLLAFRPSLPVFWHRYDFEGRDCLVSLHSQFASQCSGNVLVEKRCGHTY